MKRPLIFGLADGAGFFKEVWMFFLVMAVYKKFDKAWT